VHRWPAFAGGPSTFPEKARHRASDNAGESPPMALDQSAETNRRRPSKPTAGKWWPNSTSCHWETPFGAPELPMAACAQRVGPVRHRLSIFLTVRNP
jgi:hypothetical protein